MQKKKFDSGIVLSFALLILGIASIFFPYFLFNGLSLFGYIIKVDKYNELGDFIGGITAPFLSISAFILLYLTYKSQKQELLETRQILKEQNTTLQKQQFETTFFNLLTLHHQIINAIDFDSSLDIEFYEEETDGEKRQLKGRDCFREFFYIYIKKYRNWEADEKKTASQRVEYKIELEKYLISAAFGDFYTEHEVDFGHYYRNLQSIIEFIDNSIVLDKGFYINILRSQLSTYEIILVFYSCLWLDDSKMKTLVEKYSLLKDINHQHLNRMEDIQLIDKKSYS